MSMREVLLAHPHAGRLLVRKYGLSSGYSLGETLESVIQRQPGLELADLLREIEEVGAFQRSLQISPLQLKAALDEGEDWRLLDVRTPLEAGLARIEGSQLLDTDRSKEILQSWPKETPLLFYCHKGIRSMEAALHFAAQGFGRVRNLDGGIDRWAVDVDPSLARY